MNTAYLENDDIYYMTTFTYFLKWKHIRASYGQHYGHLGKKKMFKQKGK